MKKFLFFVVFIASINSINAQIYPKGSTNFSAGYGAVSYEYLLLKIFTNDLKNVNTTKSGPLYLKAEYAVADNFTLGLNVNYTNITGTFTLDSASTVGKYSGTIGLRSTSIIGRVNYTIPFAEDKAGFMIGAGLGYRGLRASYADNNPYKPIDGGISVPLPITGELTLGFRYYFTENIGAYVETGITRSLIQGGITARF
jgi:outer membrane protein W